MYSRTFVIGDIHGCLNELNNLLGQLNLDGSEQLIFLGDYVDRGPNSCGVICFLEDLQQKIKCVFIRGNHDEIWLLDLLKLVDFPTIPKQLAFTFWDQGARETYKSYTENLFDYNSHIDFFTNTIPYYVFENQLFVHGGYDRSKNIGTYRNYDDLYWDRKLIFAAASYNASKESKHKFKNADGFDKIYIGHTPVQHWGLNTPQKWGNVWNLDTGAGKYQNGTVSALDINTEEIYQSKVRG